MKAEALQKIVCVSHAGRQFQSWAKCIPRLRLVPHTSPATEIAKFPPLLHNILFCDTYISIQIINEYLLMISIAEQAKINLLIKYVPFNWAVS